MGFSHDPTCIDLGTTPIENIFITEFMPIAPGSYVKVYLYAYALACTQEAGKPMDNMRLAKHLGLPLEDILEAWDYWASKKLITKQDCGDQPHEFDVIFLSLRQLYITHNFRPQDTALQPQESQAGLTTLDLLEAGLSPDLQTMFSESEAYLSRPLQANERRKILDFVYTTGISPRLVVSGFAYATENQKSRSVAYILGILRNWREQGILDEKDLALQAENNQSRQALYRQIYHSMGYGTRPVNISDKALMDKWLDEYRLDIHFILTVLEAILSHTSNPNMRYVDRALERRVQAGVTTPEALERFNQAEQENRKNQERRPADPKGQPKKNPFNNYKNNQQAYSNEELEILLGIRQK